MNEQQRAIAQACLRGAEENSMTFPEIVSALQQAGFEGYAVDLRRAAAAYYLADGDAIELPTHRGATPVAAGFDEKALVAAIREAQALAPGYTYKGFCEKARLAGCAGYLVSFPGRRALYFGRTAQTHVEHFPGGH